MAGWWQLNASHMRKGKLRACVLFFFLSEFIAEYCSIRYSKQLENFCIKFLPLFYEANMAHLSSCPSELPSYFILDSIGLLYLYSLFFLLLLLLLLLKGLKENQPSRIDVGSM